MNIQFKGQFKSITSFNWVNIPDFVVITGPNGSGKSQLLELIYNTVTKKRGIPHAIIEGLDIKRSEVSYLKGEWALDNVAHVSLSTIQSKERDHYNRFISAQNQNDESLPRLRQNDLFELIASKANKKPTPTSRTTMTIEEFTKFYPEEFVEKESQIASSISSIFYNYRLSEIEELAKGVKPEDIVKSIGEKPWDILRLIILEAKLPYAINDPSTALIKEGFTLTLKHTISGKDIPLSDLSSGEKVLFSLVLYMYIYTKHTGFSKLFLLDEPDAHLHPSMSRQFIDVVKNVLVEKLGIKVIMTTHSPSTVVLTPFESLYNMSLTEPRIQKSPSKNESVSLLTAGLVYVGENTRYFLVEDEDDVAFYTAIYNRLKQDNLISADQPLVFIPASITDKSGGKSVVEGWVEKLRKSGLNLLINGLIDKDNGNKSSDGITVLKRYSIENYLIDPLNIYAALLDKGQHNQIETLNIEIGEEYKLKQLPQETLQQLCDEIFSKVLVYINEAFPDFNENEKNNHIEIFFQNGLRLIYPIWLIESRGKSILNIAINSAFGSKAVNHATLQKAMLRVGLIPQDLVSTFREMTQ